jgi:integrase
MTREERETTFAEYYARWRAARRVSRSREYTDDQRAALHVLPHWGSWPLCDIRPSDIDDWVAELSRKMGPISVRSCYGLLCGPVRRAVKDRIIEDPLIDIALPRKPEIRKTFDDVLDRHEVARLVAAVPDPRPGYATLRTSGRYQALILMGCWLGPRWNEAIGLRACDLNPLRHEVTFGRFVVNQTGLTPSSRPGRRPTTAGPCPRRRPSWTRCSSTCGSTDPTPAGRTSSS